MKLLLDTHIILWALDDNPKLPEHAKAEGMKFITHDSKIPFYNESCVIAV